MLKKVIAVLGCLIIIMAFGGCAENPEGDIIANKNEGVFEEKLKEQNTGNGQEQMGSYQDAFEVEKDGLHVSVDAEVKMLEGDIPVIRVAPHNITVEDVKAWSEVLFGGNTAYDAKHVMTKTEIEEQILELQSWINDPEELLERYGSEEFVEETIAMFQQEIALLEKQYQEAPDTWEEQGSDWTFHPLTYYYDSVVDEESEDVQNLNKTEELKVMSLSDGKKVYISAVNRNELDYLMHRFVFWYEDEINMIENSKPQEMSEEEAVQQAEKRLETMGIGEWEFERIDGSSDSEGSDYRVYFAPVYNGIPSLLPCGEVDLHSEDLYAAHLRNSSLVIRICNGMLISIELESPMDIVGVENENIQVLPFDDIYAAFQNYAESGLQDKIEQQNLMKADTITITRIEQKLFRAKMKDSEGEFRMVPVWVFYGTGVCDGYNLEEQDLVVINAVDGSIIDAGLGY